MRAPATPSSPRPAKLPVSFEASTDLLVNGDGQPIWSLRTAAESELLRRMGAACGWTLDEQSGSPGRVQVLDDAEVVVGLGDEVGNEASLYAHLTTRAVRMVDDLEALRALPRIDVVVCLLRRVTSGFMEMLAGREATAGAACGIVAAATLADLHVQVLLRAAAGTIACQTMANREHTVIAPRVAQARVERRSGTLLGGKSTAEEIRAAACSGVAVLTLATHSDGLDTYLGPLTLCGEPAAVSGAAVDQRDRVGEGGGVPACALTGFCHRSNRPIPSALSEGGLLSYASVAAGILIQDVCYGFLPEGNSVASRYGLAHRLLSNPAVGAVVTTWELAFSDPSRTLALGRDLLEGQPLGVAVARFNRSARAREGGARFCIFGDPKFRLVGRRQPSERAAEMPTLSLRRRAPQCQDTSFLRATVLGAIAHLGQDEMTYARAALVALDRYDAHAWQGRPVETGEGGPGDSLRRRYLDFVFVRSWATWMSDWLAVAASRYEPRATAVCFACGGRAREIIARPRAWARRRRSVVFCAGCAAVLDAGDGLGQPSFEFDESANRCTARGLPTGNWDARILIRPPSRRTQSQISWPRTAEGAPQESVMLPDELPRGPLKISFALMHETSITVITRGAWIRCPSRRTTVSFAREGSHGTDLVAAGVLRDS
jgi:hypothetical protein